MGKNAASPTSIQRAEARMKRDRDDIVAIMSMPAGRRVLWRLLGDCGLFRLSFHPSGSQTMFNEGQRNIGLMWQANIIEASHDLFLTMQAEARRQDEDDQLYDRGEQDS